MYLIGDDKNSHKLGINQLSLEKLQTKYLSITHMNTFESARLPT